MLKKRLIPKLQMKHSGFGSRPILVTTQRFGQAIQVGDPVSQAKIYQDQAADELIFLNLEPERISKEALFETLRRAAEQIFMPLTVGGGIDSVEDFRILLQSGADKVSINTAALENEKLISEASHIFGTQCVVVSIDYKITSDGLAKVISHGGKKETQWTLKEWAMECERRGAGELLITSIDRDGTKQGLDIAHTRMVTECVSIPVIAAGGCGVASHFVQGLNVGGASAISAGTYFCLQDQNLMQCRAHIKNAGIEIRMKQ